jgi:hypothetical protein
MKNFTKIFITLTLMLMANTSLWAQHRINGIPEGWSVKADGEDVNIVNGKTDAISAGKTIQLVNNSGNTVLSVEAIEKTAIDLEGASMLAVTETEKDSHEAKAFKRFMQNDGFYAKAKASDGDKGNEDDDDGEGHHSEGILSAIDEEGNVVPVQWDFEIEDIITKLNLNEDEAFFVRDIEKDLVLSLHYIYPIGDKWGWMYGCNMEYVGDMSGLDKYTLSMDEIITLMSTRVSEEVCRHYLIRLSDGAIFKWENAPDEIRFINGDLESDKDMCGLVEPYGDDIVYVNNDRQIVLLQADGDELKETVLSSSEGEYTKAMFVAPTTDGFIGTILTNDETLNAHNFFGTGEACAFTADGEKITIGEYSRYGVDVEEYTGSPEQVELLASGKDLFALNGTLYYVSHPNNNSHVTHFSEVTFNEGVASVDNIKALWQTDYDNYFSFHYGITGYFNPVFRSQDGSFSWGAQTLCTFNPNIGTISEAARPEHYPNGQGAFIDGMAYIIDNIDYEVTGDNPGSVLTNSLPQKVWICDLSKTAAEPLDIDWSNLSEDEKDVDNFETLHWRYWPGIQRLAASGTLKNGAPVTYNIPMTGENKGVAMIVGRGWGMRILSAIRLK